MADPIAGQRKRINEEPSIDHLVWEDMGKDDECPVTNGDVFKLRTCSIEIIRTQKQSRGAGSFTWMAWFERWYPEGKIYLLDRAQRGYVSDIDEARRAKDAKGNTIDSIGEDDRSEAHRALGEPPEPEAVPPHEISRYTGSQQARVAYEREMAEGRIAFAALPVEVQLGELRERAAAHHVDISKDLRVIEQRVAKLRRKVLQEAA